MAVVTMRQLLEAGVHFGHQTRRWNPKMKRFIWGERSGIYIIDLQQTLPRLEQAYAYIRDLVAGGGTILFVGTKKQAQDAVRDAAERSGMPYVNQRWLGGMLTNFETMAKRVGKMQEYERMRDIGEFDAMPKKEALQLSRELEKLDRNLGGIRSMARRPDAIFVLDTKKEHIAVTEANKLGIPVVAVVDTNCDPDLIQFVIPGNDDAIRASQLVCRVVSDAVVEGRYIASKRGGGAPKAAPETAVRSPEEEAAFQARQADARRQAAAAQAEREARLATRRAPAPAAAGAESAPDAEPTTDSAESAASATGTAGPVAEAEPSAPAADTAGPAGSAESAAPAAGARETAGTPAAEPVAAAAATAESAATADANAAADESTGAADEPEPASTGAAPAETTES
jgi:small subunit ribosomal protein S2